MSQIQHLSLIINRYFTQVSRAILKLGWKSAIAGNYYRLFHQQASGVNFLRYDILFWLYRILISCHKAWCHSGNIPFLLSEDTSPHDHLHSSYITLLVEVTDREEAADGWVRSEAWSNFPFSWRMITLADELVAAKLKHGQGRNRRR